MVSAGQSLKDQLFNADSLTDLAGQYALTLPVFDPDAFVRDALAGIPERALMACLDWFADCLEPYLPGEFESMAQALERAMPPPLDPNLQDGDFGHFLHGIPGVLAARHGLETHRDRALDLLYAATRRFSMEFWVRPFLNRWPDETLARLTEWAGDENYHVRRLVSEGTRPRLPWGQGIGLGPDETLPLLDALHADKTRYVTRSVANHLNDISKSDADAVVGRLEVWGAEGRQDGAELDWIARHALRGLVKAGHPSALSHLGYRPDAPVRVALELADTEVRMGDALAFRVTVDADEDVPVLVDYRVLFHRPSGAPREKVFKLRAGTVGAGRGLVIEKSHRFRGNATTFQLHPGPHRLVVQVNGADRAAADFTLG